MKSLQANRFFSGADCKYEIHANKEHYRPYIVPLIFMTFFCNFRFVTNLVMKMSDITSRFSHTLAVLLLIGKHIELCNKQKGVLNHS